MSQNALALVEAVSTGSEEGGASGSGSSNNSSQDNVPQPRQPVNLQGLLRYAIEAGHQDGLEDMAMPEEFRRPMDPERSAFLAGVIHNMTVDLEYFVLKAIATFTDEEVLARLQDQEELTPDVAAQFESLDNIIDDIDVANGFCKMRGFDCFPLCLETRNPALWAAACNLLADLTQNNPLCQEKALEVGLIKRLIQMLREPTTKNKDKFIYALSCCIREFEPGCKEFIAEGGCEVLVECLSSCQPEPCEASEDRTRTKAAFLIRYLCEHYPEAKERLIALNLPRTISHQLKHSSEHLISLLRTYVEPTTPALLKQCRESSLHLKTTLQEIAASSDPERDEVEMCNDILKIVFEGYNELQFDCEEEADR